MDPWESVYHIRCPVHGLIELNALEWEILNHPTYQRLRRIRQLAWTDQVYPGATHARLEHSLGVTHVAGRAFDAIVQNSGEVLRSELGYTRDALPRMRRLVRLAAMLHDIGHGPFSHAAEELLPKQGDAKPLKHEHYSVEVIRSEFASVIEGHHLGEQLGLRADEVAALLGGSAAAASIAFWRQLISGHVDVDRMDYLQRDSYHLGVAYGHFDLERLLHTLIAIPGKGDAEPTLGVTEGGMHAAEALVWARYQMFTQVYFHKTRVAFDHHLKEALAAILPGGRFPRPTEEELARYLEWDDWRVLGKIRAGEAGEHGSRLLHRQHFREIYHTPESPNSRDLRELDRVRTRLGRLIAAEGSAANSWYNPSKGDIPVQGEGPDRRVAPLSVRSKLVRSMGSMGRILLYVREEDKPAAAAIIEKATRPRSVR
jgi:HD superfamily phosphohydrolase